MILRELPPTSGLPPRVSDLFAPLSDPFARRSDPALEVFAAKFLDGTEPQIECSGTACLVIALEYLKTLSPRREVIVPAFTCPLVVLATAKAGLKLLPCDLAQDRFDLDEAHLAKLVSDRTLCVVATHLGHWLTDVVRLKAILPPEIKVIEDAAWAFGARQNGRSAGFAGDIGFFSFALGKGFTLYEGGALVAGNETIRAGLRATSQRLRQLEPAEERQRCIEYFTFHFLYHTLGLWLIYGTSKNFWLRRGDTIRAIGDYFETDIPVHAMSDWRKRVGARAIQRYAAHLVATRASRERLLAALGSIEGLELHAPLEGCEPSWLFMLVTLPTQNQCDSALKQLWRSPLGVSRLFAHVLSDYAYLAGKVEPLPTPQAQKLAARTLTVTTSPWLNAGDIAKIVSGIRQGMADKG